MEFIDIMTLQTQQSAELLRPFRQAVLVDAPQGRGVVCHDRHPHLHDRPTMTFVGDPRCATVQEAGNDTFDHRAAVATSTGELHLVRGALMVQAGFVQNPEDLLLGGCRGEGLDRLRNAYGEDSPAMQCRAQRGVIESQIARQRVDGRGGPTRDLGYSDLHFVNQGQHRAGITGVTHGQMQGKDEAGGWFGNNPGLAAKLGGAVALAFANGGNRGIVGIDNFTLGQGFAVGEPTGLGGDLVMGCEGSFELGVQALPLALSQLRRALHVRLRGPRQQPHRLPSLQQLLFRLAHQRHKHFPLAAALPAKAAHNLGEVMLELLCLRLQRRARDRAVSGEVGNDLEDFFFALYRVAASLTRWLPCSLGKVSTTRCAGLTRPASMAATAWIASSSSINAASMRLRKWASTSGSTKCSWEPSTWTSTIPQAYITARSVRNRLQICSSEQANSCFSNSNANNTRVETGGRPR